VKILLKKASAMTIRIGSTCPTTWSSSASPPNRGELTIREHGRAFYVFYGFGTRASTATHVRAMQLLDSLRIEPPLRR